MDINEALETIKETNEPLYTVLAEMVAKLDRVDRSQETVIEAFIAYIISPEGNPSGIDLTVLMSILNGYKSN